MKRICIFLAAEGKRIAIDASTIEAIVEHDEGCTIVTSNDTHRTTEGFGEVLRVWDAALKVMSKD